MTPLKFLDRYYAVVTGKPAYIFEVGDHVEEATNYCPEVGMVIGRFRTVSGKPYYVIECHGAGGGLYHRVHTNDGLRHV